MWNSIVNTNLNGHVKWDGNDGIEDNGVGKEYEHSDDGGTLNVLWDYDSLPRQIRLEIVTDQTFPEGRSHSTKAANWQKKKYDLWEKKEKKALSG